jgi:hypothetical protein
VHAPVAIPNPRRTDVLDPSFDAGLIAATGLVVIGRGVELQNPAGAPDHECHAGPGIAAKSGRECLEKAIGGEK